MNPGHELGLRNKASPQVHLFVVLCQASCYNSNMKLQHITESTIIAEANLMMEMANLTPDETGVPYVIWLGAVGGQHGPRIKVSNTRGKMSNDCFVVSVSRTPAVITPTAVKIPQTSVQDVLDWVMLNYDVLITTTEEDLS